MIRATRPAARRILTALQALAVAGLVSGCLSVRWTRIETNRPIAEEHYAGLGAGHATLDDALDALGAPLFVRELPHNGVLCAWGWEHGRNFGLTLEVPVSSDLGLSFDYDDRNNNLTGVVLMFDGDLVLTGIQRGRLALLLDAMPPPRLVRPEEFVEQETRSDDGARTDG